MPTKDNNASVATVCMAAIVLTIAAGLPLIVYPAFAASNGFIFPFNFKNFEFDYYTPPPLYPSNGNCTEWLHDQQEITSRASNVMIGLGVFINAMGLIYWVYFIGLASAEGWCDCCDCCRNIDEEEEEDWKEEEEKEMVSA